MEPDNNIWSIASKGIGLLPGGNILATALGMGSSVLDSIFGGTKRQIDPEVQRLLNQKKGMADKLKMQSENQEAVAQQQKTDVRQNMEGALMSSGGKAANTYNSDSSIPMSAILNTVRSQAPIASAITQGITGATTEAENRKAQLTEQSGQMYEQVARAQEELTRETPKTTAWDTIMKGMGASGLYSQMFKDKDNDTTSLLPNTKVSEPTGENYEFQDNVRTLDLKETLPDITNGNQVEEDNLNPLKLMDRNQLLKFGISPMRIRG